MTRFILSLLSVCAVLAISPVTPALAQAGSAHPMIGDQAPSFRLASTTGDTLSLEGWRGKYVVLHFGASW